MSPNGDDRLDGASPALVRRAIDDREPLPGTAGFAGAVDGTLVRDVLGRRPVYYGDADGDGDEIPAWSFCPDPLDDPTLLPAGCRLIDGALERVWSLPESTVTDDPRAAVTDLRIAIERSVAPQRDAGEPAPEADADASPPAIAFSGGVDSATIAALRPDAPLYVASFPGGRDLAAARESAAAMDRELTVFELTHDALAAAVPRLVSATGRTNPMDLAIAAPLHLLAERVAADGHDRLALGQGADELFGGYEKVARADERVAADTVRGARDEVLESLGRQLPRDVCAVRAGGVEPVALLLHDRVVRAARRLPAELLVDDRGTRKVAFRLAARAWLPHSVAFREKTAIQYGTHVSRELDRLARQAGFKRRMDDHVERYVLSLVEDS